MLEELNGQQAHTHLYRADSVLSPNAMSGTVAARVTLGCAVEGANDLGHVEQHRVETSIGCVTIVVVAHVG